MLRLLETIDSQRRVVIDSACIFRSVRMVLVLFWRLIFEVEVQSLSMTHKEVVCEFAARGLLHFRVSLLQMVLLGLAHFLLEGDQALVEDSLDDPLLEGLSLELLHLLLQTPSAIGLLLLLRFI